MALLGDGEFGARAEEEKGYERGDAVEVGRCDELVTACECFRGIQGEGAYVGRGCEGGAARIVHGCCRYG